MSRFAKIALLCVTAVVASMVVGCQAKDEPKVEPKIAPPAISEAGKLKVGVDLKTPPFAGQDGDRQAGIDIDIASALAERLGLAVVFVDVAPSDAATALAEGKVDAVMSVPVAGAPLSAVSLAGTYLTDAPGLFIAREGTASIEPSLTIDTLPLDSIAVQERSESYWLLRSELGSEAVEPYPTLRDALNAVDQGEAEIAAGDAVVAAYIIRDLPAIKFAGRLGPASPLAVAVDAENTSLSDTLREQLDALAADGVLDAVRRKWIGDFPSLDDGAADASGATSATP